MRPPRAELTPRQLAAQNPTELQELWRKQYVLQGQVSSIPRWIRAFREQVRHISTSCNLTKYSETDMLFRTALAKLAEAQAAVVALEAEVRQAHKQIRDNIKRGNMQE